MPSTPPPVALRAHTPPTPLHGPRYDNYEPYSPRRSKRSTAHSNPYSSFNSDRSPQSSFQRSTPPPTTVKKARFARAPTQLSSPPSSPASPRIQRRSPHKTPRKQSSTSYKPFTGAQSDSDGPSISNKSSLVPPNIDPITMLPTPSKTPKKRAHTAAIHSAARILSFQPDHPNDVMPSPRKIKKSQHRSLSSRAGFELYEDDIGGPSESGPIEIYTDANARVPVMDESEDNPFVGAKRVRPQRRRGRPSQADVEMEERVRNEEGVVYVFRGKKIFRPFQNGEGEGEEDEAIDLSATPDQRRLRHQAGIAAQRPLTRSTIKPRLLFPSEEQLQERQQGTDDVDEEAVTDIEMGNSNLTAATNGSLASPPPTHQKRGRKVAVEFTPPAAEDDAEPMSLGTDESFNSASSSGKRVKGKGKSPFDAWQRTKSVRKRAGEAIEEGSSGGGKRTRSSAGGVDASPLT